MLQTVLYYYCLGSCRLMVLAGSSSLDMLMQFWSDFQLDWSNLKDWRTEWLSPCGWQFCWNCLAEHLPVAPLGNLDFSQYGSCCIILIKAVIKWWKINSALQWEQGHFVEDVPSLKNTIFQTYNSTSIYQKLLCWKINSPNDLYFILTHLLIYLRLI